MAIQCRTKGVSVSVRSLAGTGLPNETRAVISFHIKHRINARHSAKCGNGRTAVSSSGELRGPGARSAGDPSARLLLAHWAGVLGQAGPPRGQRLRALLSPHFGKPKTDFPTLAPRDNPRREGGPDEGCGVPRGPWRVTRQEPQGATRAPTPASSVPESQVPEGPSGLRSGEGALHPQKQLLMQARLATAEPQHCTQGAGPPPS